MFHHHDWKQVKGVYNVDKKGNTVGIYFYCTDCSAIQLRLLKNCPVLGYEDDEDE